MTHDVDDVLEQVCDLVDETRTTCLWHLRQDYHPRTVEEALRVLEAIERRGDLPTFQRAARLRAWLLRRSNEPSAAS